jgi:hypothetical protein
MRKGETILKLKWESTWSHEPTETYRIIRTQSCRYFGQYTKDRGCFKGEQSGKINVETELDQKSVDALFAAMSQIKIQVFPEFPDFCDGAFYELEVGDYGGKSVFRWWCVPPPSWAALDSLANQIVSMIPDEPPPAVLCPHCGSSSTIPIIYGMPMHTVFEDKKRGELVIGGCCQEIGAPDRKCKSCKYEWLNEPAESAVPDELDAKPKCEPCNAAERKIEPFEDLATGVAHDERYAGSPAACDVCKAPLAHRRFMIDGNT